MEVPHGIWDAAFVLAGTVDRHQSALQCLIVSQLVSGVLILCLLFRTTDLRLRIEALETKEVPSDSVQRET